MPNRNKLTNTSEKVVQQKGIKSTGKLFDCLVCDIAEGINVLTTSSNMEKRRLLWSMSMYNSINTWFKLLKKELIALGFARGATAEDGDIPRNMKSTRTSSHASEKWNRAITSLKSRNSSAFNHVLFVLQHDDWYTDAERNLMKRLSAKYPFTNNQRIRINNPPSLQSEEDLDYHCAYDCSGEEMTLKDE